MVLVQKWPFSYFLFLGNINQENVFYDILERVNAFIGYKSKKFKKSNNSRFSKGVNPLFLVQKWPFSYFLFLGNINQENVFYDILERVNAFIGYKSKKFKKSNNSRFSKGVNPLFLVQKWQFFQISFINLI